MNISITVGNIEDKKVKKKMDSKVRFLFMYIKHKAIDKVLPKIVTGISLKIRVIK